MTQKMTLKAARINSGLSLEKAAKALNIAERTLNNYENSRTFPNAILIKKMEKLYQVAYDNIIFLK